MHEETYRFVCDVLGAAEEYMAEAPTSLWIPGNEVPLLARSYVWTTYDNRVFHIATHGDYVEITGPRGLVIEMWVNQSMRYD